MMGNCSLSIPFVSSCFVISNLALAGIPFLAGFYSKDLILEITLHLEVNLLRILFLFLATGLTVIYTFRLIYYVVARNYIIGGTSNLRDGSGVMVKSTLGLIRFSIFFGAGISWLIIESPEIFLPSLLKNTTLVVCISGAVLGFFVSQPSLNSISCFSFYSFRV